MYNGKGQFLKSTTKMESEQKQPNNFDDNDNLLSCKVASHIAWV